jgi:hypothetical protein
MNYPNAQEQREIFQKEAVPPEKQNAFMASGIGEFYQKLRVQKRKQMQPYFSSKITSLLEAVENGRIDDRELRLCRPLKDTKS